MSSDPPRPSRGATYGLLAGLYVSQLIGVGFFYTGLTAILRSRGASLEQLSLIQTLGLLWALKFLWAPLVDRYGSYRRWLLVLQPAIAVALLGMLAVDPVAGFGPLMLIAALVVLLSTTQDVAADALAVRVLDPADRGVGNGIQIAGGYLGNILGGGAVLVIYDRWGWAAAVLALAVFTALPVWQVWRYREPAAPAADPAAERPGFRAIRTVFRAPGVARWALGVLPLYWIGTSAGYALVTPMLVDIGWSLTTIGLMLNIVAGAVATVGAVASGWLVRKLGRHRAVLTFGVVQLAGLAGLLPLAVGVRSDLAAGAAVIGFNLAYAAVSTIIYTINMDLSRPESPGSDYTLLSSFAFFASLSAGAVSLAIAGTVGYLAVLTGAAVVMCAGLLAARIWFVDRSAPVPAAVPVPA